MFNFLSDGKLKWSQLDENFDTVVLNAENGEQDRFKFMRNEDYFIRNKIVTRWAVEGKK